MSVRNMELIQRKTIEQYLHSYNNFDIDGMLKNLHKDIVFENESNGVIDLTTNGKEEFKVQAESAKQFFSERKQTIQDWSFHGDKVVITIVFEGVLAIDLPGGVMQGDTLELNGSSEFLFKDGQIIGLKDES